MSKYKVNNVISIFVKILTVIIVVLLILGIVGGLVYFLNRPQGLYVEYNGVIYGDTVLDTSSGGLTVDYGSTATFKVCNSDGWGVYSVQDCTVKIVPNVDETHDFEFTVEGDSKPSEYSGESDLTAAFVENYDGNGLPIAEDGTFTITANLKSVKDILEIVYGKSIVIDGQYYLYRYPYVALSVISPDGEQNLTVPLLFGALVEGINIDMEGVVF